MKKKGFIRKGEYFDSVSLMIISKELTQLEGVIDSAVVMGTKENKDILDSAGLLLPEFRDSADTDLLIAFQIEKENLVPAILEKVDELFLQLRSRSDDSEDYNPKSFSSALQLLPDANLSLISIPGKYAAVEAMKALKKGLHVMLFSDHVSLAEELKLKKFALQHDLFVMGPDCGTAIINGVPLAFANVVNRGNIGIVAASGTGLQEVSSIISNLGEGISQAIGTGGRDVKKEIGGIMFLKGIEALNNDPETEVIVLVSKPPDNEVLDRIVEKLSSVKKPVVTIFIGGDEKLLNQSRLIIAQTLEQAALMAVSASRKKDLKIQDYPGKEIKNKLTEISKKELKTKNKHQKYVRGLFSGGTLCDETQLIFYNKIGNIYSNTPLNYRFKLKDSSVSVKNTVIDLGDDEFTVGRPHPMIDFSLRNERILQEISDPEVAVILLDLVIGYGSNLNPEKEFIPAIAAAKKEKPQITFICSITGTDNDPQNRKELQQALLQTGSVVCQTNAEASFLAAEIIEKLGGN
jgi:FdrA protein